jgi:hypothetical protein
MKQFNNTFLIFFTFLVYQVNSQDTSDYIEFDDTKNTIHGVYLGLSTYYGEIEGKSTYLVGGKIAYVANKQFEIGFAGVGFYSDQKSQGIFLSEGMYGGYAGLHLEPIFFGKHKFNLAIPILIGGGAVGYIDQSINDFIEFEDIDIEEWGEYFVFEPGLSLQYNISRFIQVEAGIKYRLSSNLNLYPGSIKNINGISGGIGVKFGVFNMRRE